MTISDDTGTGQPPAGEQLERPLGSLSRYDLVLAVIPLVFGLALVSHTVLSLPLSTTMAASAVVTGVLVVDAMFLNPPASPPSGAR